MPSNALRDSILVYSSMRGSLIKPRKKTILFSIIIVDDSSLQFYSEQYFPVKNR